MEETIYEGDTYTYTARSMRNPNSVITITLIDHRLHIDLPELLDKLGEIASSDKKLNKVEEQVKTQIQPTVLKVAETISGPIYLSDVRAFLNDNDLAITAWKRVGGLRLAPLKLKIHEVDNVEAAEAFISTLEERKASSPDISRFVGPLDYWIGWIGLFATILAMLRWPRKSSA